MPIPCIIASAATFSTRTHQTAGQQWWPRTMHVESIQRSGESILIPLWRRLLQTESYAVSYSTIKGLSWNHMCNAGKNHNSSSSGVLGFIFRECWSKWKPHRSIDDGAVMEIACTAISINNETEYNLSWQNESKILAARLSQMRWHQMQCSTS